ncbi:hypothetical protein NDU88_008818 [Pleurodeles waltl]|uniref:Uncharacterized protein n=1 Tax=Pleurodeles waltl TaxID=8319 RepID=A0AAV7RZ69_PLEWA|nr:hypothetical protein NDU88_008818 [Pleurodeles waltl]
MQEECARSQARTLAATLYEHTGTFLKDVKASLEPKIDVMAIDFGMVRVEHRKLVDKVDANESTLTAVRLLVTDMHLHGLQKELQLLLVKANDAEARFHIIKVWIIGLPERVMEQSMELYLEKWLVERVLGGKQSMFSSVVLSHGAPGYASEPGAPPRAVVVHLFNYRH